MANDQPVLLYDGGCRFCRASAALVRVWDRSERLAVLPFDDAEAEPLLAPIPVEKRSASMHVVEPDGTFVSAGDAVVRLAELLPGAGWLGRWARRQPRVRNAVASGYHAVADRRGLFGRFVPDRPRTVRRRKG